MSMNPNQLKNILEAALLAAEQALSIDRLLSLFVDSEQPSRDEIREALASLAEDYKDRGIELKEVSSGFRLQVRQDVALWVSRLWEERPSRYSRALLETLVLVAYKQPVTRGDIEDIRGVSVSSHIIKTLQEREWVRVLGHREVPGRPALYGTTKQFLDYFNLKSLEDLPPLDEIKDLDDLNQSLNFGDGEEGQNAESSSDEQANEQGEVEQQAVTAEDESTSQEAQLEEPVADSETNVSEERQADIQTELEASETEVEEDTIKFDQQANEEAQADEEKPIEQPQSADDEAIASEGQLLQEDSNQTDQTGLTANG